MGWSPGRAGLPGRWGYATIRALLNPARSRRAGFAHEGGTVPRDLNHPKHSGYANVDSKATVSGLGSASDKSWDLAWGVGVGFNFAKKLHVRVEYEQFDVSPDYDGVEPDSDLYMLSASAAWRF